MLQKNSFFSSPLIYFGTSQDFEDRNILEDSEWIFFASYKMLIPQNSQTPTGLFIHWEELEQFDRQFESG